MSSDEEMAAFLAARLDEDEAALERNTVGFSGGRPARSVLQCMYGLGRDSRKRPDGWTVDVTGMPEDEWRRLAREHSRSHAPRRPLREVEAKRAILAEYKAVTKLAALTEQELGFLGWYREWVLKHFAAVYSDHPDYREEWEFA